MHALFSAATEKELFLNNYTLKTAYDAAISEAARNAIPNDADYYVRVLVLDNVTGGIACDENQYGHLYQL